MTCLIKELLVLYRNKKIVGQGSLNAFWSFYEGVISHEKTHEDNDLRFKNGVHSLLQSGFYFAC